MATLKNRIDVHSVGRKIKTRREQLKLSMRELAASAGLAVSFLSRIEAGKASPTVMSLVKILEALQVEFTEFFKKDGARDVSDQVVFKKSEMKVLEGQGRTWAFAFPGHPAIKAVLTYEEYRPRTRILERERHRQDIFGSVVAGELTLEIVGRGVFTAGAGDAFYLKAGQEHVSRNDGTRTLKMVVGHLRES
jgi:transcriptional regulator with XRE-family HTH domain